jgi:glucose-1-phosphate thymidylyltransferase
MKGIILAGGAGTRLYPITSVLSKQLLPVYDKPMIYYPLSTLMLAGIRAILIITTPHDADLFKKLLGDGTQFGLEISYAVQEQPRGLADAFIIGRDFIGSDRVALILGDNIFFGHGLPDVLRRAADRTTGATIFAYEVRDPERYGVISFDGARRATSIEEKPKTPNSNWAVTGLYFYDNAVLRYAEEVKPSARGELEAGNMQVERMGRGYAWFDTGTMDSLLEAAEFVATLERRQGLKICCPEEIALRSGFITAEQMEPWLSQFGRSSYAAYIRRVAPEASDDMMH